MVDLHARVDHGDDDTCASRLRPRLVRADCLCVERPLVADQRITSGESGSGGGQCKREHGRNERGE